MIIFTYLLVTLMSVYIGSTASLRIGTQLWQCPSVNPSCSAPWEQASLKLQGKWEVKGRLCIYHLPPIQGDVTLVQMFTLFFYFPSSWALSTHWREAGTWDLKVMNSIALAVFIDVVSRWLWCLYFLYMGSQIIKRHFY